MTERNYNSIINPFRVILVAKFKRQLGYHDPFTYVAQPFAGERNTLPRYERPRFFDNSQAPCRAIDAHELAKARLVARMNAREAA